MQEEPNKVSLVDDIDVSGDVVLLGREQKRSFKMGSKTDYKYIAPNGDTCFVYNAKIVDLHPILIESCFVTRGEGKNIDDKGVNAIASKIEQYLGSIEHGIAYIVDFHKVEYEMDDENVFGTEFLCELCITDADVRGFINGEAKA